VKGGHPRDIVGEGGHPRDIVGEGGHSRGIVGEGGLSVEQAQDFVGCQERIYGYYDDKGHV
jgi:hypothetical protein